MADSSPLVGYLDRAAAISKLAGMLHIAFQQEVDRGGIDPTSWGRHKPAFDQYCQAILDLRRGFPTPPEGSGAVPDWLREAGKIGRRIARVAKTSDSWRFCEYFPELNTLAQELHRAVNQVRKTLNSVDPLAVFDEPMVADAPGIDATQAAKPDNGERDGKANSSSPSAPIANGEIMADSKARCWAAAAALSPADVATLCENFVGHLSDYLQPQVEELNREFIRDREQANKQQSANGGEE
jgi:hypothetical protein